MAVDSGLSLFWAIRLACAGLLFLFVLIGGFFIKQRKKYTKYLENRLLNLAVVIFYIIVSFVPVLLPSDNSAIPAALFMGNQLIIGWYAIIGLLLVIIGFIFYTSSIMIRKTLGAEDTGRLITTGPYGFCRHPIYFGCSLTCLGVTLLFHNPDGLLVVPLFILINLLMGKLEEKYDMGVRFKDQYSEYKTRTGAFGPVWFWIATIIAIILPLILAR